MARRKKTSTIEDVMELVSMLPWWAGVGLAIVGYLLLHAAASQTVVAATQVGQMGTMVTQTLWKTFANVGQYALPIICLAGAAMSAWKRKQRKNLITNVTQSPASDALDGISWQQFEMLVGEGFRLQGYTVVETGGGGADGGVDLVLSRPGKNGAEKFLVQCKQWRAFKVGVDVVRELYGVMAAKGAAGGFVVTSGRFTDDAIGFATGRNVTLINGQKLNGLIRQAEVEPRGASIRDVQARATQPVAGRDPERTCPSCSQPMILRTAKRGANAGREFWGCTGYPVCRGTRPFGST
jgi:restriction system protein